MILTDEQWLLVAPLLNDHNPLSSRGRPPLDARPILDAILWKIRHNAAWENLPSCYPSPPTCYRRYRLWRRDGLLDQVFLSLYKDLLHRGRFDLQRALHDGLITVTQNGDRYRILVAVDLIDTWQLPTALVIIQLALTKLKRTSS